MKAKILLLGCLIVVVGCLFLGARMIWVTDGAWSPLNPMGSATQTEDETVLNQRPLESPLVRPRIVVLKGDRRLELFSGGRVVRRYPIALGTKPTGDKMREGDRRTPEGEFAILIKNPNSTYTLSLGLDYPGTGDAARGLKDGLITQTEHDAIVEAHIAGAMPPQKTALGGDIFIHGKGSRGDWTWGCIALDDEAITELYAVIPLGAKVLVKP